MDPPYSGLPGSDWESCQNGFDQPSLNQGDLLSHVLGCGSFADHLRFRERIQCQECDQFMEEPCWFHAKSIPSENVVPFALASLPPALYLDISYHSPTGKCVLAKQMIASHTIFGPVIAPTTETFRNTHLYAFPRSNDGTTQYFQLESDLFSNWMRYVRFAENSTEANLAVYLRGSQVVFVSTRMILPGEELQVCYSVKYAKTIGRSAALVDDKENICSSEVHKILEAPLARDIMKDLGSPYSHDISDECGLSPRSTVSERFADEDAFIPVTVPVSCEALLVFPEKSVLSSAVVESHLIDLAPLADIVPNLSDEKPPKCRPLSTVRADSPEIGCYHPVRNVSDADLCEVKNKETSPVDIFARKLTLRSAAKLPSTTNLIANQSLCPDLDDMGEEYTGSWTLRKKDLNFSRIESDADSDWQPEGVISEEDSDSEYETIRSEAKPVHTKDKTVSFRILADKTENNPSPFTKLKDILPRPPQENLNKHPLRTCGTVAGLHGTVFGNGTI